MTLAFEVATSLGWISTSGPDGSQAPRRMRTSPTKGNSWGSELWSVWFLFRRTVRLGGGTFPNLPRVTTSLSPHLPRAGHGQALQSICRLSGWDGELRTFPLWSSSGVQGRLFLLSPWHNGRKNLIYSPSPSEQPCHVLSCSHDGSRRAVLLTQPKAQEPKAVFFRRPTWFAELMC